MSIRFIIDSTVDVNPALLHRFTVIPLTICFGREEFIDGVTISNYEFYEKLIKSILHGSYKSEESTENKAINYWWGLSAGVIDVICSNNLPAGTVKLVELMKKTISSGDFHPLTGPLVDQEGNVHYEDSEVMKPEDIMRMDWLVDNVVGSIPTIDDLNEEAQPVVMLRGLYSATADKGGNSLP